MNTYYAFKNEDGTECGCTSKENWEASPKLHQQDAEGKPMTIIKVIEAETWDEAMTQYHKCMGFEPYVPMED